MPVSSACIRIPRIKPSRSSPDVAPLYPKPCSSSCINFRTRTLRSALELSDSSVNGGHEAVVSTGMLWTSALFDGAVFRGMAGLSASFILEQITERGQACLYLQQSWKTKLIDNPDSNQASMLGSCVHFLISLIVHPCKYAIYGSCDVE
jgi:hypothetical protein